jgi:hypothetical protein
MPKFVTAVPYFEDDFAAWLEHQITLMRERDFAHLDLPNLLDELELLVSSRKNALRGRLQVLIAHLLKYEFQPHHRSLSWLRIILTQRNEIERLLEQSPSLAAAMAACAQAEYRRALRQAILETGLFTSAFAPTLPYPVDQLLDFEFLP